MFSMMSRWDVNMETWYHILIYFQFGSPRRLGREGRLTCQGGAEIVRGHANASAANSNRYETKHQECQQACLFPFLQGFEFFQKR